MLNYFINLKIGDYSFDGHCQTGVISIMSSLSKEQIVEAYNEGCKILGFDFITDYCSEYEDNKFPENKLNVLKSFGFEGLYEEKFEDEEDYRIYNDDFYNIYLFFVRIGNKNFQCEIINDLKCTINIGGYGLFGG